MLSRPSWTTIWWVAATHRVPQRQQKQSCDWAVQGFLSGLARWGCSSQVPPAHPLTLAPLVLQPLRRQQRAKALSQAAALRALSQTSQLTIDFLRVCEVAAVVCWEERRTAKTSSSAVSFHCQLILWLGSSGAPSAHSLSLD